MKAITSLEQKMIKSDHFMSLWKSHNVINEFFSDISTRSGVFVIKPFNMLLQAVNDTYKDEKIGKRQNTR